MVELGGIERGGHPSPTWSAVRRISFNKKAEVFAEIKNGGARRDRTADLLRATQALSQLSYSPTVGNRRLKLRR